MAGEEVVVISMCVRLGIGGEILKVDWDIV